MPTSDEVAIALDTSVAVPLLVRTHTAHELVVAWWRHRPVCLSGHALVETHSVLTWLPGDLRLAPADAPDCCPNDSRRPYDFLPPSSGVFPRFWLS